MADTTIGTDGLFAVRVEHLDGCVEIELSGELDLEGVPRLREEVWPLLGRYEAHLVTFDCARLSFVDSSGAGILVKLARAIAGPGRPRLESLQRSPKKVLDLLGVSELFDIDEAGTQN